MNALLQRNARELGALNVAQMHARAAVASCRSTPYALTDANGRDDDAPHIGLIDEAIASLQAARAALDLNRPQFAKADGFIEEAGRVLRELEEMPCGSVA